MLQGIIDFLTTIGDAILSFLDLIVSSVKDVLLFIGTIVSVPEMLRRCFTWLPSIVGNIVFAFIAFIIFLRVIKYLGD